MDHNCDLWIASEFKALNFGDKRLCQRFKMLLTGFMRKAQENISATFDHWGEIKACYRFLNNSKVTPDAILHCHKQQTLARMAVEDGVLLLHDTTYLDYGTRSGTKGLDIVGSTSVTRNPLHGLILHNSFALSTNGVPLGIFGQSFVDRKEKRGRHITKETCCKKPVQNKESIRWIKGIQDFSEVSSLKHVVHIADREADIYELYKQAIASDELFLIRARLNRSINKKSRRQPPKVRLFDYLETLPVQGAYQLNIQVNAEEKYRQATINVSYAAFSLPAPPNKTVNKDGSDLPNLAVWAIIAREEQSCEKVDAVKWLLITNMPINTLDEAIEKIRWYSYRWNIELFHKILKSGCSIEKAQLRQARTLKNYITMKSIIAWRLFWITRSFYKNKNQSCEDVLRKTEWQILYRRFNKGQQTEVPPNLEQVYYWIARLGGYINRRSAEPPGIISIWKGWTRFCNMVDDFKNICG